MQKIPKIAILMDPSRAADRKILRGIYKYANLHGPWDLSGILPRYNYTKPTPIFSRSITKAKFKAHLKSSTHDGIIARLGNRKQADDILPANVPKIIVPIWKDFPGYCNLATNNASIGKTAAEHLLNRGFRHYAYCGSFCGSFFEERGESFSKTIADAGFQTYLYKSSSRKNKAMGETELSSFAQWLKQLPKPVGIMLPNDDAGQYVFEACRIAGVHVPEEAAVLGVGNDEMVCELSLPPLSSLDFNYTKTGYKIAEKLDKMMTGEDTSIENIEVQVVGVVKRKSTDILAIEDSVVADAIRFIQEHVREGINVTNVCNDAAISRRVLERRFRNILKRSILDEIRRVRVELAARMLLETNMSISQIAFSLGFPTDNHIGRYFKKIKGLSPQAYRQKYG